MDSATFHLVVIRGFDTLGESNNVEHHFSQRFPQAVVNSYAFIEQDFICFDKLQTIAGQVLEKLLRSRANHEKNSEAVRPLPIVFLGHGLGCYLIKQIIILATEESRFHGIFRSTSSALFYGAFCRPLTLQEWESQLLSHISESSPSLRASLKLFDYLIDDLKNVTLRFSDFGCTFNTVECCAMSQREIKEIMMGHGSHVSGTSNPEGHKVSCSHNRLWSFEDGDMAPDEVCTSVLEASKLVPTAFYNFIRLLFLLNTWDHPFSAESTKPQDVAWIQGQQSFLDWQMEDGISILHAFCQNEQEMTAFSSCVSTLLARQPETSKCALLNFSSHKSERQSTPAFDLYVSLCRQILATQPNLLESISTASKLFADNCILTAEVFWVLFRSLAIRAIEQGEIIYCLFGAIDDNHLLSTKIINRMTGLSMDFPGKFKLMIVGTNLSALEHDTRYCRDIEFPKSVTISRLSMGQDVSQDPMQNAKEMIWEGLKNADFERLSSTSDQPLRDMRFLLLQQMTTRSTRRAIQENLNDLPESVEEIFSRTMRNVRGSDLKWVSSALWWILHARRPLKPSELAVAIAWEEIEGIDLSKLSISIAQDIVNDLRQYIEPLFIVKNNKVYPIHERLRILLFPGAQGHLAQPPDVHLWMLRHCLDYLQKLLSPTSPEDIGTCAEFGFASYACTYWPEHYKCVAKKTDAQDCMLEFLNNDPAINAWADLYGQLQPPISMTDRRLTSPVRIVCNFGLVELVGRALSDFRRKGGTVTELTESLDLAVLNGHTAVVQVLLNEGITSSRALGLAAIRGNEDIAHSILAVDGSCLETPDSDGYTPLHLSVCAGEDKMVVLLLDKGADPRRRVDGDGNTALHLAAEYGHSEVTKALLGVTHDVASLNNNGMSSVDIAAFSGHLTVLSQHFDIQREKQTHELAAQMSEGKERSPSEVLILGTSQRRSVLEWAAAGGHAHIVNYLMKINTTQIDADLSFALLLAAEKGHVAVVKEILSSTMRTMAVDCQRNTALHAAASSRSSQTITQLLKHSFFKRHINDVNEDALTALHVAVRSGHLGAVVEFLRFDAKVNINTSEEDTIVHLAVKYHHYDILVELLRNQGAHEFVNFKNNGEMTPLHLGAEIGSVKIVDALLDHEADVNLRTDAGDTALHLAARRGHLEVVQRFCIAMDTIWLTNNNGRTALDESILERQTKVAREFIIMIGKEREKTLPFMQGETLHVAAEVRDEELFALLLDRGMDCTTYDGQGYTPLHIAAASNFANGIKMLLATSGSDVNVKSKGGETPLYVAADHGNVEAIRILLDHDADIDAGGPGLPSPLFIASYRGRVKAVQALLAAKPKPDLRAKGYGGWYPIHGAYDNAAITQLLLTAGANTAWLTEDDYTSLALACTYGYAETVKVLLEAKADPNFGGNNRLPPLHLASLSGQGSEILNLLIEAGADKNAADEKGSTLLHLAAYSASEDTIRYLLEQGLDVHARSREYGTVLTAYMANHQFSTDFADFLLRKGIDVNDVNDVNDINCKYSSALYAACAEGLPDAVLWVLAQGADVHIAGGRYLNPLHAVIANVRELPAELVNKKVHDILAMGANVDTLDTRGMQPIHTAAAEGQVELLKQLVEHGADPLSKDRNGRSMLMHAVACRRDDVVDYCLEFKNLDVAEVDITARTPLMTAVLKAGVEIVDRLLIAGYAGSIDAQDAEGKTALMHAVIRGNIDIVQKILGSNADPTILDHRQRSALYWAARTAPMEFLDPILNALNRFDKFSEHIEAAVHGAIASRKPKSLHKLMSTLEMPLKQTSFDGWTLVYTAERYELSENTEAFITELDETSSHTMPQHPLAWHPCDRSPCLHLEPDRKHITVALGPKYLASRERAVARADYPMWPMIKDSVYYFEIKIIKAPQDRIIGVGFCEDRAPLDRMVGWDAGSWGYHGDDGYAFNQRGWGSKFGPTYKDGDVVGCGVNFAKKIAYYTMNGDIIGPAFTDIKGKLYPAVSFSTNEEGAQIVAIFGDGSCSNFCFKGPYDGPDTLKAPSK